MSSAGRRPLSAGFFAGDLVLSRRLSQALERVQVREESMGEPNRETFAMFAVETAHQLDAFTSEAEIAEAFKAYRDEEIRRLRRLAFSPSASGAGLRTRFSALSRAASLVKSRAVGQIRRVPGALLGLRIVRLSLLVLVSLAVVGSVIAFCLVQLLLRTFV